MPRKHHLTRKKYAERKKRKNAQTDTITSDSVLKLEIPITPTSTSASTHRVQVDSASPSQCALPTVDSPTTNVHPCLSDEVQGISISPVTVTGTSPDAEISSFNLATVHKNVNLQNPWIDATTKKIHLFDIAFFLLPLNHHQAVIQYHCFSPWL